LSSPATGDVLNGAEGGAAATNRKQNQTSVVQCFLVALVTRLPR
jgi:hypothetical protein